MDDASTKGALVALIVAPGEIAEGKVTVKSMKEGTESRQPLEALFDAVGSLFRA